VPIDFQVYSLLRLGNLPLKASADFGPGVDTIFKLQMGDMSLGEVLQYLVNLAVPDMDFELTPPWDVLNDINLRNLTLEVDVTRGRVGFAYQDLGVDLTFLKLTGLEVWYGRGAGGGGRKSVDVSLFGTLLGQDFTDKPITWDVLNQPAPAVPGTGAATFDLEYLGLGQHVTLRTLPGTMGGVIDQLEEASQPIDPTKNPLSSLPKLKFDASSGWLIGTKFSVLGAVSLSAVFNDPNLYGLLVGLSGPRVGSLAGLQFEILYRKISPTLGLYSIHLKLPDAVRTIDVGEASITLPVIDLDVYTNGNFLVNLGFPRGLDFSNSFTFQVIVYVPAPIPIVGAGT